MKKIYKRPYLIHLRDNGQEREFLEDLKNGIFRYSKVQKPDDWSCLKSVNLYPH